ADPTGSRTRSLSGRSAHRYRGDGPPAATPAGHTPCPRAACPADAEAGPGGNGSARTRPAAAATGGSRGCWRPTPARRGAAPAGRTARAASSPACPGRPGLARSAPPYLLRDPRSIASVLVLVRRSRAWLDEPVVTPPAWAWDGVRSSAPARGGRVVCGARAPGLILVRGLT